MISLTYLSTAVDDVGTEELADLLDISRRNNHAAGLTGMLLHAGGSFIQTLEGPAARVDTTFARIQADPRHRELFIAWREDIEQRVFPDWSMGFEHLSPEEAASLPGFNDYLDTKRVLSRNAQELGRAGIFHRVFRDTMR